MRIVGLSGLNLAQLARSARRNSIERAAASILHSFRVNDDFCSPRLIIVVVYLILSVAIGMIGRRYVGSVAHYLVAGRELGVFVGIATLAATEIGTITFMYNAELGYRYGFAPFVVR